LRRGIALFITLSVITAMAGLLSVMVSYLDRARADASDTAALIQADILYRDGAMLLSSVLAASQQQNISRAQALEVLYAGPVVLQPEKAQVFVEFSCRPLDNAVPIYWLGFEQNATMQKQYMIAKTVFENIAQTYDLQSPDRLYEQILYNLGAEDVDEPEDAGRLTPKKGIISSRQFERMVRAYRFAEDDPVVEAIAWTNFFSFDKGAEQIDASYLSAELIALFFGIDLAYVQEEQSGEAFSLKTLLSNNAAMSNYDASLFSQTPIERMRCSVRFGEQEGVYQFAFDFIEGRAERFEFLGKQ
jgi:hypothetical protein